ncbi:hypothetical protein TNCV_2555651 [Trichonephila clavipes]|nr:hypothetical protein TNCV_2555651 [Trichonephila clavipes]
MSLKTCYVEELLHIESVLAQSPHVGMMRKFRERETSSDVLFTLPWFKITRFVASSPRIALQYDVAKHSLINVKI